MEMDRNSVGQNSPIGLDEETGANISYEGKKRPRNTKNNVGSDFPSTQQDAPNKPQQILLCLDTKERLISLSHGIAENNDCNVLGLPGTWQSLDSKCFEGLGYFL